jgi:hypothetical protein
MPQTTDQILESLAELPNGFFANVSSTGGAFKVTFGAPKPGQRQPVLFSAVGGSINAAMEAAFDGLQIKLGQ